MTESYVLLEAFQRDRCNADLYHMDFPKGDYRLNLIDKSIVLKISNFTREKIPWSINIYKKSNSRGTMRINHSTNSSEINPGRKEQIPIQVNQYWGNFKLIIKISHFQLKFKVRTSDRTTVYNIRKATNSKFDSPLVRRPSVYKFYPISNSFERMKLKDWTESNQSEDEEIDIGEEEIPPVNSCIFEQDTTNLDLFQRIDYSLRYPGDWTSVSEIPQEYLDPSIFGPLLV